MREWVEGFLGTEVSGFKREYAGGSRPLWYVLTPTGEYVLRLDTGGGALSDSPYNLDREIAVYASLRHTGVPVPELLATNRFGEGQAILMSRVHGDSRMPRSESEALSLIDQLTVAVAHMHNLDARKLELSWGDVPSMREAIAIELGHWERLMGDSPRVECVYAIKWLRDILPLLPGLTETSALVQGDTGPGNAIFDGDSLAAIVDWELSHLGDPMEDIAWLDQRCSTWDRIEGARERRLNTYQSVSKRKIDLERVRYHAVFVRLRCAIITARTIDSGGGALGCAVYEPARNRFIREMVDLIIAAIGFVPPDHYDINKQVMREIDFDEEALVEKIASHETKLAMNASEKLRHRERTIQALHEWVSDNYGDAIEAVRAREDVRFSDLSVHSPADVQSHLVRRAARLALLWPDPAVRLP